MKLHALLAFALLSLLSPSAKALTLPELGQLYFVGTTTELFKVRAAIAVLDCQDRPMVQTCVFAGGPPTCSWAVNRHCDAATVSAPFSGVWQMLGEPFGLGGVDCMTAYVGQGTLSFLGRSAYVDGELIQVPTYAQLATQSTWPQACYGYQFGLNCAGWMGEWACPDPSP